MPAENVVQVAQSVGVALDDADVGADAAAIPQALPPAMPPPSTTTLPGARPMRR